jgi:hypothetical protein
MAFHVASPRAEVEKDLEALFSSFVAGEADTKNADKNADSDMSADSGDDKSADKNEKNDRPDPSGHLPHDAGGRKRRHPLLNAYHKRTAFRDPRTIPRI